MNEKEVWPAVPEVSEAVLVKHRPAIKLPLEQMSHSKISEHNAQLGMHSTQVGELVQSL